MRKRQLIVAALLTLGLGGALFAISIPIFSRRPDVFGSMVAIPFWGQLIWFIGSLIYSLLKRQAAVIAGVVIGLTLELATLFVLVFYVFPPRF